MTARDAVESVPVITWNTQAARTFGVVVALAIVLGPMADNGSIVKMDQHGRTPRCARF